MNKIRFLSKNGFKTAEATRILEPLGIEVSAFHIPITELQTGDMTLLVRDKALKAFHMLGHPLFIEQTGLLIDRLNGFPGGLTQVFWDALGPDRMSAIFGQGSDTGVTAVTRIGYCDGKKVHQFEGQIRGTIPPEPRGDRSFQWDCVFVPDGERETFAEMGDRKNEISMRRRALDAFVDFLKGSLHA